MLKRLREQRLCEYQSLLDVARKSVSGGEVLFIEAINFLYLLGLVDYHPKNDAFEYVGPNAAV
jgi:hypothetical protein